MADESLELVAASLRAGDGDVGTYLEVLATKLMDTFPSRTRVERKGFLPGSKQVRRVALDLGDDRFALERNGATLTCEHGAMVRGVVLRTEQLGLDEWARRLAAALTHVAESSERDRLALERLLL